MRAWHRHVAVMVVVAAAVAASATGCKTNTIDNQTNNNQNNAGINVIGPQGGIVLGPEGSSVRIPAGALTKDETISIRVVEAGLYPPVPGTYTTISKVFAFEPHGLKFLTPAIITIPFTADGQGNAGLTGIRAEGTATSTDTSSWQPIQAQIAVDAQISTPGFSYYAIARTATQQAEAGPSCSGRGPDNSAPTGSPMGFTGTYKIGPQLDPFDISTVKDGYADLSTDKKQLRLRFSDFAKTCGYAKNNVDKIGGKRLELMVVQGTAITTQTYTQGVSLSASELPASTPPGFCGSASDGAGPGAGNSITITALDATHVEGSFNFAASNPNTAFSGSFNIPICASPSGGQMCCVP